MKRGAFLLCAALAAVFVPRATLAQTGRLTITVFDESGKRAVAGVEVTLSNSRRLVPATTVITGKDGIADFPVLTPGGGYSVEIVAPGHARQRIADLSVKIGEATRIPVQLAPELTEKVVLVKSRDTVDLDVKGASSRFDQAFIQDLPYEGRFYQGLLPLVAGVQDSNGDGNPNVHGARDVDFKALVGGVSNQDPLTGEWMSFVHPESIEEIEVITSGAGVEYGRAQGGFANVIQKQGSNDFEGVASLLWRSSALDGRAAAAGQGEPDPEYQWFQPSIQISGPIVKDRLWYRLSHEYIHREEPVDTIGKVVVTGRRQMIAADQITWQVSPRNKLALQFQSDPQTLTNLGASALRAPESSIRQETGGRTLSLAWTAPFSAKLLVDTVISHQNSHQNILPSISGVESDCMRDFVYLLWDEPILPLLHPVQCTNQTTGRMSGSLSQDWRDRRQRFTTRSQATIYGGRFLGMTHQFKTGLSVENERYYRRLEKRPELFYSVDRIPATDDEGNTKPLVVASISALIAVPRTTESRATGTSWALFAEDQVKPVHNVTVTLGIRLDREQVNAPGAEPFDPAAEAAEFLRRAEALPPEKRWGISNEVFTAYEGLDGFVPGLAEALGLRASLIDQIISSSVRESAAWDRKRLVSDIDIQNTNVSPRLAIAWDPWSNGKTKLALTAGRYYDKIMLAVPLTELEPVTSTVSFSASRWPWDKGWRDVSFAAGVNPAVGVKTVDRRLRTPYQDELSIAIEREILPETSVKLTFIRRDYRDQLQDIDINHHTADFGTCVNQVSVNSPWIDMSARDGLLDDCDGRYVPYPFSIGWYYFIGQLHRPDGYLDNYVYNPGWGSVFEVGNSNSTRYKAFVLEVVRRQYRNWQFSGSYTYSRAVGDAEDFLSSLGNDRTLLDSERGYLSYDQRHVVKVSGTTITPWGFRLGATASWMTGLPYSLLDLGSSIDSAPPPYYGLVTTEQRPRYRYVNNRRNDQRNPPYWNFNVKLDKEMNFRNGMNVQLSAEIFNLFNDRQYIVYNPFLGYGQQVNGKNEAFRTLGRQYQIAARIAF